MGRTIDNPRYNVISVRISDQDLAELTTIAEGRALSDLLREAVNNHVIAERQKHYDQHLRSNGL